MNKILLLTAIIFLTFTCVQGQTNVYHPFPDSNAVWCGDNGGYDGTYFYQYNYSEFIRGDSTIGGLTYHKLYKTGHTYESSPPYYVIFQNQFSGLYRQDVSHRKVYVFDSGHDTLLYNFNLSLYDTLPESVCNSHLSNYISSIDSIMIDNSYRKRFWLSRIGSISYQDSAYVALIEGVGSTFGFNEILLPPFEYFANLDSFSGIVPFINAPYFCGVLGIETHEFIRSAIQVYPNPFSTVTTITIRNDINNACLVIFNTLGQRMKEIKNISSKEIRC